MSTYPLIPTPPGDWQKSLYDLHAIRMASIHNIIIRSFNSVIHHAPNINSDEVPSFMKYCNSIVAAIHEHHITEEEVIFPAFEKKLGEGSMELNVAQHQDFLPKFDEWSDHCKNILANRAEYKPNEFIRLMRECSDVLAEHLVDEIPTIESTKLQQHFTESELKDLEQKINAKAQQLTSLWDLPLMFVNGDLSYNSWFPPVPAPVVFVARHVLMRISGDMWKYGQSDKYMNLKEEYKPMYVL